MVYDPEAENIHFVCQLQGKVKALLIAICTHMMYTVQESLFLCETLDKYLDTTVI